MAKEKEEEKEKENEKECPFRKGLRCQNCRLFQVYSGSGGKRVCPFIRMP